MVGESRHTHKTSVMAFSYEKGQNYVQTGVKNNRRPKNAVAGGNGTFVISKGNVFSIYVNDKDGYCYYHDITEQVREVLDSRNKRLTRNNAEQIYNVMASTGVEIDDDLYEIVDIEQYIKL